MHNPFARFAITDDWNDHIARGSAGGVDWATPVGTPIEAPEDGYLTFILNNGTGGHTATLIRDPNHSTQLMHLSQFAGGARNVKEGELIGLTGGAKGAPGAGSSTGPHVHAHSYEFGKRVPPFFLHAASGMSGDKEPIIEQTKENEMYVFTAASDVPDFGSGWDFAVAPGFIVNTPGSEGQYTHDRITGVPIGETDPVQRLSTPGIAFVLRSFGLGEFIGEGTALEVVTFLKSLGGGKLAVASWRQL